MTIPTFTPDSRLVSRALADDPAAFETLVARYQRQAFAIVRALGVTEPGTEDVVQEAFLKAFENLPRLRSRDAFGPWFLRIVRNTARDSLRATRNDPTHSPSGLPPENASIPAASLERRELGDRVWSIARELPESVREAILLYYHAGESVRSVAKTLGLSRSAVLKRLQRGRELLRERLWRELEESLREMIPSAREWRRRGRRLTLVLFGAATGSWAGSPGLGAAAGSPDVSVIKQAVTGGIGMSGKKTALLIGVGICLLLTGGYLLREQLSVTPEESSIEAARAAGIEPATASAAVGNDDVAVAETDEAASAKLVRAAPRPAVVGTVRDSMGRPIAGARLVALDTALWRRVFIEKGRLIWDVQGLRQDRTAVFRDLHAEYLRCGEAFAGTESREDGTFVFTELAPGEYRILAGHPDHVPALDAAIVVEEDTTSTCNLELARGRAIGGRVVDDTGLPLEGVSVVAHPSSFRAVTGEEKVELLIEDFDRGAFLVSSRVAQTRKDGSFRLDTLRPGRFDLTFTKDGLAEARRFDIAVGAADMEVTLTRGLEISGRVLDARGNLLPESSVLLERMPEERPRPLALGEGLPPIVAGLPDAGSRLTRTTKTDDSAGFSFGGLVAGEYRLAVTHPAHPPWNRIIELREESLVVDIGLEEALAIAGKVLGPDGKSVAGARVWIEKDVRGGISDWGGREFFPDVLAQTFTDQDGNFALTGLGEGVYEVRATSREFAETAVPHIRTGEGRVQIQLNEGVSVLGVVVDGDDGRSLPDARVALEIGLSVNELSDKETVTDADGLFEIHGIPRDLRMVSVRVSHDDYPGIPVRIELGRATIPREVTVELHRPDLLTGRVVTAEGNPVAGAAVSLETGRYKHVYNRKQTAAGLRATRSGLDGVFSVPVLHGIRPSPSAPWTLVARHPLHGIGRIEPLAGPPAGEPWPEFEIILGPPSSLSGHVVGPGGASVAGARVRVTRMELVRGDLRETDVTATAFSGTDGIYRLDRLEPGTYTFEAGTLGFAPIREESLEVTDQPLTYDVALEAGVDLEGSVVDPAGRPVEGAEVHAFRARESDTDPRHLQTRNRRRGDVGVAFARSDREGRWTLANVPRGETSLVARAPGYRPSDIQIVPPGGVPRDLVVEPYAALSGSVIDSTSAIPVSRFQIYLRRDSDERSRFDDPDSYPGRDFTSPRGEFFIDRLPAGSYVVGIDGPGYVVDLVEVTLRPGEETNVRFELRRGRRLLATVRDVDSGQGIADVSVSFHQRGRATWERRMGGPEPYRGVSDSSGRVVLDGLVPGKYRGYANHPDYKLAGEKLELEITEEALQDVTFEIGLTPLAGGTLAGTIENLRDRESIFPRIELVSVDDEKAKPREAIVDFDGTFEVPDIPPGNYEVRLLEKFPTEKGKQDMKQRGTMAVKDTVEKVTVLGSVGIVEGITARFEYAFAREEAR